MKKQNKIFPEKSSLKVIGGIFKGHTLHMVKAATTRSTKAILKESLFNTLAPILYQHCFIEVFSGTGSVGIEALSRGAKKVQFIEKDPFAYKILQRNLGEIQKKYSSLQKQNSIPLVFESFLADSFEILPKIIHSQNNILFFDPPFPIRENFSNIYQRCFQLIEKINQPAIIIFESLSSYEMPQNIKDFSIIKAKKFGKSSLIYYANH